MSIYGAPATAPPQASPNTFAGKLQRLNHLTERAGSLRNSLTLTIHGQGNKPPTNGAATVTAVPNGLLEGFDATLNELDEHIQALEHLRTSID